MTYIPTTQKLLDHLPALAGVVRRVAVTAGDAIMEYFDEAGFQGTVDFKGDNSPVTIADTIADDIIRAGLADIARDIPVVTEETAHLVDHAALNATPHYWLVDGLDGTKAFRKGDPDFTVNIALIHHTTPVLGVIYAPALGDGYIGIVTDTSRAYKWNDDDMRDIDITVRHIPKNGLTLLTSTTQMHSREATHLMESIKLNKHIKRHSSIKFCEIATGRADVMIAARDIYFWDTAAGDAIIRAAGGFAVDLFGQPLNYDRTVPHFVNFGLIAGNDLDYIQPIIEDLNQLRHPREGEDSA